MASSLPSSVKNELTGPLYAGQDPNISYSSLLDTSVDHSLPNSTDTLPPQSTSIPIESSNIKSDDLPFDNLQGFSAPTLPVYLNMGLNDHGDHVAFAGPVTTNDDLLSRSLAAIDVDQALPPITTAAGTATAGRHSQHHHHHFPHHSQNRNRYPYLQRSVAWKSPDPSDPTRASTGDLPYYGQRPALRRSYFALRRQRIPKAPPMPRHLYPGYKQTQVTSSTTGGSRDSGADEEEEGPPSKSFWIILRLVFFFFAIEFMYAIETALTIPIFSALHVSEEYLSMAWIVSPILGFFVQPIIGMWSDTCKCRWGRRRPFILAFAIGAFIGVTLLLNSADIGLALHDSTANNTHQYIGIALTAVGVTFLDFCADSADAPIRAYLIDTTNPSDQERGFNIHAILGGFGGGLGYIIGAIKQVPKIPIFREGGGQFSIIYFVAAFLFIFCTIATLTSVREEPLISSSQNDENDNSNEEENDADNDEPEIETDESRPLLSVRRSASKSYKSTGKPRSAASIFFSELNNNEGFLEIDPATGRSIPHDQVERPSEDILLKTLEHSHQVVAASLASADPTNPTPIPTQAFEAELKQKAKLVKLGLMRRPPSEENDDYDKEDNVTIKAMLISMVRMPPRLWKLMICQVIGWIGYFATHLYYTDYVASVIYKGSLESSEGPEYENYIEGVGMGCWGLFVYSSSSAVYAFCLERWLAERFSLNTLYFVGYFVYTIGCLLNYFLPYTGVTIGLCFTFGMLVVSLNTIPYHMLSQFHADETYRNRDGSKRGIGIDCSLLNACYFLGELVMAASLGPILGRTGTQFCMILGAIFTTIGNISMFFLFFYKQK